MKRQGTKIIMKFYSIGFQNYDIIY